MGNILFSPLGLTDPISNFKDGSLLNICRFYDIDKVYLYLSAEVYEYHKADNRYVYCLNKLSELKGKEIEIETIIRKDLEDVHIFDYFIDEFRKIVWDIHNKNLQDQLYLNVSSGTPAMKSALHTLATLNEFYMIPLQVSTPEKRSNPHAEDKRNYNPIEMWECNEDNIKPENRCSVSENFQFLLNIKKQMLIELIENFDYVGAKTLADTMLDFLNEKFVDLLEGACKRTKLDIAKANNIYKKYKVKLLNVEQTNYANIAEYFLLLDLKVKKEEYSDFLRGVSPLLVALFEEILLSYCKINISKYTYKDKKGVLKWDMAKLNNEQDLIKALNDYCLEKYKYEFKGSFVSSEHLLALIDGLADNQKLKELCTDLRKMEAELRNKAAHTIVCVTDEWIFKNIGFNSKTIISKINEAFTFTNIKLGSDFFSSYNRMNEILIESLKK